MHNLKNKLASCFDIVRDVCIDNSDGNAKARTTMLLTGYITSIISAVTNGIFFTAFMVGLGASDVYIGYITMIPPAATFVQLIAPLFWEKIQRRKPSLVAWSFVSNVLSYLGTGLIPFLNCPSDTKLALYATVIIIISLAGAFFSPANQAWPLPSLPFEKRVNFSALTHIGDTVLNLLTAFLASMYLDQMASGEILVDGLPNTLVAAAVLRLISFGFALVSSTLSALNIKEYPYEKTDNVRLSMLLKPFMNKEFMLIIIVPALQTVCLSVIGDFSSIHLITNVNLSYTAISVTNFLATPLSLLLILLWTTILKKRSWLRCLAFSYVGYAFSCFLNVFISANSQYFFYVAVLVGVVFQPCMNLVSSNLLYMKLPEENRTVYLVFYSIFTQGCVLLGKYIGTLFVQYTGNLKFCLFGIEICNLQLVSAIAAIGLLATTAYTLYISRKPEYSSEP